MIPNTLSTHSLPTTEPPLSSEATPTEVLLPLGKASRDSNHKPTTSASRGASTDGENGDGEHILYLSLASAIKYLFIHSDASPTSPPHHLPVGEALTVHTLRKLFLLCGIKRHHCDRFVSGILAQLLRLCFPGAAAEDTVATLASSRPEVAPPPQRRSPRPATSAQPAPAAVRRLWLDAKSWDIARRSTVDLHTLLLSQVDPQTRDALQASTAACLAQNSGFVLCVTQEAAEKLVSRLFIEELRGQMMTVNPIPRWRMACRLLNDGEAPIVLFCGGTSGSGKSTLASLLAAQLGIDQVLSTDTVRQILRTRVKREDFPELFVSTYEAFKVARRSEGDGGGSTMTARQQPTAKEVVDAYERQANLVLDALDKTLNRMISRGQSAVVEGVHLHPAYMAKKQSELWGRRVICCSVLVQIRKEARHRERFAVRAKCMTLDPKGNKYVSNFAHIRAIQSHFNTQAERLPLLNINNTNVDKSFMMVHHALLQVMEHVGMQGWPTNEKDALPVRPPANVNAKKMLLYLQEHRQRKKIKAGPRRVMAPRSCCARHRQLDERMRGGESDGLLLCPHMGDSIEGPCAYCKAIQLLTTSVVTRTHSAELLTASQRRQFDAPPQQSRGNRSNAQILTVGPPQTQAKGASHGDGSPRRSYSYEPVGSPQQRSAIRHAGRQGKGEAGHHHHAEASDEEEDETGSLVDERQ